MSTAARWRAVCAGCTAADVVRHLSWTSDWLPGSASIDLPAGLARATGLDERLHRDEVAGLLEGMQPEDVLVASGHYGPRVPARDDADAQTRLLALVGRRA